MSGVLSSTFLTLVLLPVLYAWVETKAKPPAAGTPAHHEDRAVESDGESSAR